MAGEGDELTQAKQPVGFAQAATSLVAAGLRQALGLQVGSQPETSDPSWIERLLRPHRQALGSLGELLPRVLARVKQLIDSTADQTLLFRARPAYDRTKRRQDRPETANLRNAARAQGLTEPELSFYEFIDAVGKDRRALVTRALSEVLRPIRSNTQTELALAELARDPRRQDLPRLLDELKHEVRADRVQGFVKVRNALLWLLKPDAKHFSEAYELLNRLSDDLGETCFRELRRRSRELELLPGNRAARASQGDSWAQPLRTCFASFGYQLSDRLSVVPCGSDARPDLLIMDHARDCWFEVRQGPDSTDEEPWSGGEIYGAEAGREYRVRGQLLRLPLRTQDARQGFATWSIDRRLVQESRELFSTDAGIAMRAFDSGANRTPVALFFVHYRDTDIGEYYELGLGCLAAPEDDPLSVGVAMLGASLVSTQWAKDVSEEIWGYRKEFVAKPEWTVSYRTSQLECSVNLGHSTLTLRLPRGGLSFNSASPMLFYTRKPAKGDGQWHRSVAMRFAGGESIRTVGSGVEVRLEINKKEEEGKAFAHPLLGELYRLGLVDRTGGTHARAMNTGWSEHIEANLGSPILIPQRDPEFD